MKTLWNKGKELDQKILNFTVGNDREIDCNFIKQDIVGSIGHVLTLKRAEVLTESECYSLCKELIKMYNLAEKDSLRIEATDEDVHSMLENFLIRNLGAIGKKVHTARSRNDQIATDISLWVRSETLSIHSSLIELSRKLTSIAEKNKDSLLLGMTHLQPAMPSSIGAWLSGYASLFLEDAKQIERAYLSAMHCPLGSAAGYGVPSDIISLDRQYTAQVLGFSKPVEPVTAVQGGRGKIESTMLFGASQVAITCSRLARDLVLYANPQFGFVKLPEAFTTGSSIMPQKKNPDVAELVRSSVHSIQSCMMEVMSISSSVSSGYHRDFQRLKYPLVRGVKLVKEIIDILNYIVEDLEFDKEKISLACHEDIYATKRALELVNLGIRFRDAYKKVAQEVEKNILPEVKGEKVPNIDRSLTQIKSEITEREDWGKVRNRHERQSFCNLIKDYV